MSTNVDNVLEGLRRDEPRSSGTPVEEVDLREINDDLLKFLQDDLVRDDLLKGVDLQKYSEELDKSLFEAEQSLIFGYVEQSEEIAGLYHLLKNCDSTLESMEGMLGGFQTQLGTISSEIKSLQDLSLSMNIKLRNRKETQLKLSHFIEGISLPPELVVGICQGPLDEKFVSYLSMLQGKQEFAEKYPNSSAAAAKDVSSAISDLILQAVSRIRSFLLETIHALQTPKTNIQIKQGVLQKYKFFYEFLQSQDRKVSSEIRSYYVDTLSRVYCSEFRRYLDQMSKELDENCVVDKHVLLGVDVTKTGGLFSSKKSELDMLNAFDLREREGILGELDQHEMNLFVQMKNHVKFRYEQVFCGTTRRLMNACISEYLFITEFFSEKNMFVEIFGKTISLILENLEDHLFSSFDGIGTVLMIQILWENQLFMRRHRVPCLDHFFERVNMILWPKFSSIIEANTESLQKLLVHPPTPLQTCFIVRRFSGLLSAIAFVNQLNPQEIFTKAISTLFAPLKSLLLQVSSSLPSRLDSSAFIILQYDFIMRCLHGKRIQDSHGFEKLLVEQLSMYVEQVILSCREFENLVRFIESEDESMNISDIVEGFRLGWKSEIESIYLKIKTHFNAENWSEEKRMALKSDELGESLGSQTQVLKKALTQLVVYHHQFQQILQAKAPHLVPELVSGQLIRQEIKKYRNR